MTQGPPSFIFEIVIGALAFNVLFGYFVWKTLKYALNKRTRALMKMSEENTTLLNILCHDLGNPLTVLEFATQRFKPEYLKIMNAEDLEKNHKKINHAMRELREILDKVKKLQEMRTGKRKLVLESVDPVQVTKDLAEMYEEKLQEKNLQIDIESYLDGPRMVKADRTLLKNEVLANLISNAIKFSPSNRLIQICFRQESEREIGIYIRDYGVGIPHELIPKIFDFNANTTRLGTKSETGTGLGLPLAKTCMQMMKGSIDVESYSYEMGVSGPGTLFTLKLQAA